MNEREKDSNGYVYLDSLFDFSKYVIYFDNIDDQLLLKMVKGLKETATRRSLSVPEFAPPAPVPAPQTKILTALTVCEKALVESGRKIIAIKEVRQRLNCGLKDAKDHVDEYDKAWKAAGSPAGGIGPDADGGW